MSYNQSQFGGLMSKTVAFHLQKGGVGKTTISGTLACQSALEGHKTLILDCDPQGNLSSWFLKEPPKFELSDVLQGRCYVGNAIVAAPELENLSILPTFGIGGTLKNYSETKLAEEPFILQDLVKEFALMSKLKGNSNVVSYENHQVIEHKDSIGWDILIQMELLTPLDEYIQKKKALPRQEIIKLGIDLCKAKPGWIAAVGDTVVVTLPPISLLDHDFIDEARTKSFFESGRWTAADREAMYRRAYNQMFSHGFTRANIRSAENNADAQFRGMLRAMGFENIIIRFEKE